MFGVLISLPKDEISVYPRSSASMSTILGRSDCLRTDENWRPNGHEHTDAKSKQDLMFHHLIPSESGAI